MKKYLAYHCDTWHTRNSRELIAVATTKEKAIKLIQKSAKEDYGEKITEDGLYMLESKNQTQDFAGDGEFLIEEINENTLIY